LFLLVNMLNTFSENLYDILNLKIDASDQQIKQSFRQLSLKFHPDKDKDPIIKDKYLKILEAYEVLGDCKKKIIYDKSINKEKNIENNTEKKEKYNKIQEYNEEFKAETIRIDLEIKLEEAYLGCLKPISVKKINYFWGQQKEEIETIYVTIPEGIDNNESILIKEKGNSYNNIMIGDIKVFIKISPNALFIRNGMDLIYKKEISLTESLCGVNFEILHLNQKKYIIKNNGEMVIKNNEIKKISNLGMKRDNYRGNLIIEFEIKMPEFITSSQKQKLIEIF